MKPSKSIGWYLVRSLMIVLIIALAALVYIALEVAGAGHEIALSISGVVLIGGAACLIIKSNEKRLGVVFICVGFACRPLASFILPQFGIGQSLAATIGTILTVVIVITGLGASGPIVRKLRLD